MSREHEAIPDHDGRRKGETYVFHLRTPKARKRYFCDACSQEIPKGIRHVKYVTTNVEGPGWETWRIHGECFLENIAMFGYDERPAWRWLGD